MPNDDIKKALSDLRKANDVASKFIDDLNGKINALDLEYAKMEAEDRINKAKLAKDILLKK